MFSDIKLPALSLGFSLLSSVIAHPTANPGHAFNVEPRDNQQIIVTTGVQGSIHPRLEIRDMYNKQPSQWNLFIQAMARFQAVKQSDSASYFQIAGIHGAPGIDYNNVHKCQGGGCDGAWGYCPHERPTFPGWHRAYVAHFEQEFMAHVNFIAQSYPAGQKRDYMMQAASTMRFPYWDWAIQPRNGLDNFPSQLSQRYMQITDPRGHTYQIENPLFRFHFQDASSLGYQPWASWPYTLRTPDGDEQKAHSEEDKVTSSLNGLRSSLADQISNLFQTCNDFGLFSNEAADHSNKQCHTSIESIHDTIHTFIGAPQLSNSNGQTTYHGGHMTSLAVAAFDPSFWLHHANVDRLFALWQAVNPGSYWASQKSAMATWTSPAGEDVNLSSPLTPFYKDNRGNFWTSYDVYHPEALGYSYPELMNNGNGDKGRYVTSQVNNNYGRSASGRASRRRRSSSSLAPVADAVKDILKNPLQALDGSSFEYVANIRAPRFALNGSYSIYFFNGKPACDDAGSWINDANFIGLQSFLAEPGMTDMASLSAGSIPLSRTLTKAVNEGCLSDMAPSTVSKHLTENLTWRVFGPGGNIESSTIPGFEVAVFSSTSSPITDLCEFPKWTEFFEMPEVTCEKSGGAKSGSSMFRK